MRPTRILIVFALLVVTLSYGRAEQNRTWTGTLVDASCYLTDNTQSGDDHMGMKECGKACLKMGRPAGILMSDKSFLVLIAPSPDIAGYVGEAIRVTGTLRNGSILVDKFEVKKGTAWSEVKISKMM